MCGSPDGIFMFGLEDRSFLPSSYIPDINSQHAYIVSGLLFYPHARFPFLQTRFPLGTVTTICVAIGIRRIIPLNYSENE